MPSRARRQLIRRGAFHPLQSFIYQNLTETFPVDFNDHIISALTAACSCRRPTRPDYERLLQKFLHALFGFFTSVHRFIQRNAEMQALIVVYDRQLMLAGRQQRTEARLATPDKKSLFV